MPDIVICEPLRTPVGRFTGALRDVPPETLAATVIRALVDRTGIDPAAIDDVVLGQAGPNGEAPALGRIAALDAGLGIAVPGYQVDRRCGSGLQAVLAAAGQIASGGADVVVAKVTDRSACWYCSWSNWPVTELKKAGIWRICLMISA